MDSHLPPLLSETIAPSQVWLLPLAGWTLALGLWGIVGGSERYFYFAIDTKNAIVLICFAGTGKATS
jgi:hypothetical protein